MRRKGFCLVCFMCAVLLTTPTLTKAANEGGYKSYMKKLSDNISQPMEVNLSNKVSISMGPSYKSVDCLLLPSGDAQYGLPTRQVFDDGFGFRTDIRFGYSKKVQGGLEYTTFRTKSGAIGSRESGGSTYVKDLGCSLDTKTLALTAYYHVLKINNCSFFLSSSLGMLYGKLDIHEYIFRDDVLNNSIVSTRTSNTLTTSFGGGMELFVNDQLGLSLGIKVNKAELEHGAIGELGFPYLDSKLDGVNFDFSVRYEFQ